MTDLAPAERTRLIERVFATEAVLRELLLPARSIWRASQRRSAPALARIPRHGDDRHFPKPIWAEPSRAHAASRAAPNRERWPPR